MIHTDETLMTAGTLQFTVNDEVCYRSTTAKGGVFNCGLTGTNVKISCTERKCTPNFAISMVRVWTNSAVSASSYTSTAFLSSTVPTLNSVLSDATKVFLSGSLTDGDDSSQQLFNLNKGRSRTPAFILQLPYRSRIKEILVIA